MLKIGCHLSFSDGYLAAAKQTVELGGNTFQYFSRNPRGGSVKALNESDIQAFLAFEKENDLVTPLAHAPYTLNACSADPKIRHFAEATMADDLARLEHVPGSLYNFHPGSHVGQGTEAGIEMIASMLNRVLKADMKSTVLLETMAGKGSEVGRTFEELQRIIERVELSEKVGVCLDTCHVWDAGYDIVGDLNGVLENFDKVIGLSRLKAIHLNDSKNPLGAHKDRHEKIGQGYIGKEALLRVVNHPLLRDLPFYLETPNDLAGYGEEIAFFKSEYSQD